MYVVVVFDYQYFGVYLGLGEMVFCGCIVFVGWQVGGQVVVVVVVGLVVWQGQQIDECQGYCIDQDGVGLVDDGGFDFVLVLYLCYLFGFEQFVELVCYGDYCWVQGECGGDDDDYFDC